MVNHKMLIHILSASLLIALTTGCQGQNPFKRQSNPVKDYPKASEANEPYVPGERPKAAPTPEVKEEPVPCFELIQVATEPADSVLRFSVGQTKTYTVVVNVGGPVNPDLSIKDQRPEGSELRLISRQGNQLTYNFIWTPNQSKADKLTLTYASQKPENVCEGSVDKVSFNVEVGAENGLNVSLQDFKNKISFGDKFDFKVIVEDPQSSEENAPIIQNIQITKAAAKTVLNAVAAVTGCDEQGRRIADHTFEFICSFDSNLIKGVDQHLNSNATLPAGFQVVARSSASGLTNAKNASLQQVDVVFENANISHVPIPEPKPKQTKGAKP